MKIFKNPERIKVFCCKEA